MNYIIKQYYNISVAPIEFLLEIEDDSFIVLYGRHINGYFICIPELNIAAELNAPNKITENTMYLTQSGIQSDYSYCICKAISEQWEKTYHG